MSPAEPNEKNAIVFVDGQNLYRTAKDAFGYNYPNYNIKLLSEKICATHGWRVVGIYFYTGVPDIQDDSYWHNFWSKKLSYMGRVGIKIFNRSLRYHNKEWKCPSCNTRCTSLVGHEKGVDVRIALDVIKLAHEKSYDVAVICSQDQDLSEVVDEVRTISKEQNRLIKVASAFPVSPTSKNKRGINKTEWIKIDKRTYDLCIDPNDYR
ncbi:MAG: NYN domain-containing protein [Candidatus Omnitrophota bacterium]